MRTHEDLVVWQRAMELAEEVYEIAKKLPREELFGLRSQITRAAVSIPSNIAEGHGKLTAGEFVHFLGIARGSLTELRTALMLIGRVKLVPVSAMDLAQSQAEEVNKMLNSLIRKVTVEHRARKKVGSADR